MRLLVPLDGSAASAHALSHALWLAEQHADSTLILLNVQNAETLDLSQIMPEKSEVLAAERSEAILKNPAAWCTARHARCETRAEYGPVAETIDRIAREMHADQIVMGTRGLGRYPGDPCQRKRNCGEEPVRGDRLERRAQHGMIAQC